MSLKEEFIFHFKKPDAIWRIFWPSREEIEYFFSFFQNFPKKFFHSTILKIALVVFFICLFSEWFGRKLPSSFFHEVSPSISALGIIAFLRVALFLRFKTFWRSNFFLDIGLGILLGMIIFRIKALSGTYDFIPFGKYFTNLMDLFGMIGLIFLFIGGIKASLKFSLTKYPFKIK